MSNTPQKTEPQEKLGKEKKTHKTPQNRQKTEAQISIFTIAVQNQNKQKSIDRDMKILATKKTCDPQDTFYYQFTYLSLES